MKSERELALEAAGSRMRDQMMIWSVMVTGHGLTHLEVAREGPCACGGCQAMRAWDELLKGER